MKLPMILIRRGIWGDGCLPCLYWTFGVLGIIVILILLTIAFFWWKDKRNDKN